MDSMTELVREQLEKAQKKQKQWYDKTAREREFKPGDKVLVYTPSYQHQQIVGEMARTLQNHTSCGEGDVHGRHV